jgi:hypothetical protein
MFQFVPAGPRRGLEEGADAALAALADLYGGLQQEQGAGIDAETASRLVDGLVEQRLSGALSQVLNPVIQQVEALRSNADAQTLLTAFPEMADPKVAKAVIDQAAQAAQQMGVDPSLARRPGFIELVYKRRSSTSGPPARCRSATSRIRLSRPAAALRRAAATRATPRRRSSPRGAATRSGARSSGTSEAVDHDHAVI